MLCSLEGEKGAVGVVVLGFMRWVVAGALGAHDVQQRSVAAESARQRVAVARRPAVLACHRVSLLI